MLAFGEAIDSGKKVDIKSKVNKLPGMWEREALK
jgi:hypothetical protein